MSDLSPAVYLISGASRGLGRATVEAALSARQLVVAGARNPATLESLQRRHPDRLRVVELDVTDDRQVEAAVRTAVKEFGRLDVLVNNAGYANISAIEQVELADFAAQLDTNLLGVVRLTRAALPQMRVQGSGHVIQVSSVGGRIGSPGLAAYQAAKWAVGGFSAVLAAEVAGLGIKVTVLEPGGMPTDWAGSSMRIHPIMPAYQPTVGAMVTLRDSMLPGRSDPAKVAELIISVAGMVEPPKRLLVGVDAYRVGTAAGRDQLAGDEKWRQLSESTTSEAAGADPASQSAS